MRKPMGIWPGLHQAWTHGVCALQLSRVMHATEAGEGNGVSKQKCLLSRVYLDFYDSILRFKMMIHQSEKVFSNNFAAR